MKKLPFTMRVSMPGMVRDAIRLGWTAELLAQCFNDMELDVAQSLLDEETEITEEGDIVTKK